MNPTLARLIMLLCYGIVFCVIVGGIALNAMIEWTGSLQPDPQTGNTVKVDLYARHGGDWVGYTTPHLAYINGLSLYAVFACFVFVLIANSISRRLKRNAPIERS